jgi:hypothetical protein
MSIPVAYIGWPSTAEVLAAIHVSLATLTGRWAKSCPLLDGKPFRQHRGRPVRWHPDDFATIKRRWVVLPDEFDDEDGAHWVWEQKRSALIGALRSYDKRGCQALGGDKPALLDRAGLTTGQRINTRRYRLREQLDAIAK